MGYRIIESGGPPTVVEVRITDSPRPLPEGMNDPMPEVYVTFSDGREKCMFSFYPDEISFEEKELLGLTEREVMHLHLEKDKEFLKSQYE